MTTMGIKVKRYTDEVNIINNNDIERRLLKVILLSFGMLSVLYIIFLGNMIFNVVERRTIESEARALSNEVMDLEATYLSMSSKIDLNFSKSLGFSEAKATFATRKSLGFISNSSSNEI